MSGTYVGHKTTKMPEPSTEYGTGLAAFASDLDELKKRDPDIIRKALGRLSRADRAIVDALYREGKSFKKAPRKS